MGQIVFNEQKPKYANKLAITTGLKANEILDENEIWLIDSTVDSASSTDTKSSTGKGEYDKYIKGDGQTAAKNLPLRNIVPISLSELAEDATHRTVTDEDKQRWNSGTGGSGTVINSSDDIVVIPDQATASNYLQFADKAYDTAAHSGLGRVYLKKNIQTINTKATELVFDSLEADSVVIDAFNAAKAPVDEEIASKQGTPSAYTNEQKVAMYNEAIIPALEQAYGSFNVVWKKAKYHYGIIQRSGDNKYIYTNDYGRSSMAYCYFDVQAGDIYKITAKISDTISNVSDWMTRFWILTEIPEEGATTVKVLQAYKENNENFLNGMRYETEFIEIQHNGRLWINYISYDVGRCTIERVYTTEQEVTINTMPALTAANTEYIIQYDYDLAGGALYLPDNSVLKFEGGSISNGYIVGANSFLNAPSDAKIIPNITLMGKWRNVEYYPKWFGAVCDGVTDDTDALQRMLDLPNNIGRKVDLIWRGNSFKTSRGLYLNSSTYIYGGYITAEFENPFDWIMQTNITYQTRLPYEYYIDNNDNVAANYYYYLKQTGYYYSSYWQEFDGSPGASINHSTNCYIEGLTLHGNLTAKHMVSIEDSESQGTADTTFAPIDYKIGDYWTVGTAGTYCGKQCSVGDILYCIKNYDSEYKNGDFVTVEAGSEEVWDTTYNPIFGGLKLNAACWNTRNVTIDNVAIGMSRGACLQSSDTGNSIKGYFTAFVGTAINGHTVKDCYLNANANFNTTPYYEEYQHYYMIDGPLSTWLNGNGGDGRTGSELSRPKTMAIRLLYAYSIIFDNPLTDNGCQVGIASMYGGINMRNPWWEGVLGCYMYVYLTRITLDMPNIYDGENKNCEYDFIGDQCSIILSNSASNRVTGKGGTSGVNHKYYLGTANDSVQVLNTRTDTYPDDSRFSFLTNGEDSGLKIEINPNTPLVAAVGKYYKFTSAVETLSVTLPAITSTATIKPIMISLTNGSTTDFITFTTADSAPIAYYNNYDLSSMNSEYEISCIYNGTKWIIAAAVID